MQHWDCRSGSNRSRPPRRARCSVVRTDSPECESLADAAAAMAATVVGSSLCHALERDENRSRDTLDALAKPLAVAAARHLLEVTTQLVEGNQPPALGISDVFSGLQPLERGPCSNFGAAMRQLQLLSATALVRGAESGDKDEMEWATEQARRAGLGDGRIREARQRAAAVCLASAAISADESQLAFAIEWGRSEGLPEATMAEAKASLFQLQRLRRFVVPSIPGGGLVGHSTNCSEAVWATAGFPLEGFDTEMQRLVRDSEQQLRGGRWSHCGLTAEDVAVIRAYVDWPGGHCDAVADVIAASCSVSAWSDGPVGAFSLVLARAVAKLPRSSSRTVFRVGYSTHFSSGQELSWSSFSSCTTSPHVLADLCCVRQATVFAIHLPDFPPVVAHFSSCPQHHEVLLPPGACLRVGRVEDGPITTVHLHDIGEAWQERSLSEVASLQRRVEGWRSRELAELRRQLREQTVANGDLRLVVERQAEELKELQRGAPSAAVRSPPNLPLVAAVAAPESNRRPSNKVDALERALVKKGHEVKELLRSHDRTVTALEEEIAKLRSNLTLRDHANARLHSQIRTFKPSRSRGQDMRVDELQGQLKAALLSERQAKETAAAASLRAQQLERQIDMDPRSEPDSAQVVAGMMIEEQAVELTKLRKALAEAQASIRSIRSVGNVGVPYAQQELPRIAFEVKRKTVGKKLDPLQSNKVRLPRLQVGSGSLSAR
mmetsp:Transcript_23133/g.51014  ORF Transcript_23133/g.51014 Transcript_23133/m.51014 type:complete len:720 (+) Transcript_23133:44-2203(+)